MSFRSIEFKKLNDEFNYAAAPILDGTDSSAATFENLIDCYNTIVNYAAIDYERKKNKTKDQIQDAIGVNRITLQRCYEKLNIPLTLPGKLLSTIHYLPSPNQNKEVIVSATQTEPTNVENSSTQSEQINTENSYAQTDALNPPNPQNSTMDKAQFLKLCGSQINYTYAGDPLTLESFLASIDLLKDVGANQLPTLKLFILARLSGKAQESVRKNPASVDEIVEDLKKYIKPDDSKIIESRLQALRFNTGKPQEFTKQAEELSESLQRTLILEGVSQEKAREMTVERTIDLCRQSSKTDFVRGIIASTSFQTPKDVLAKFIVENSKEKTEKQILSFRSQNFRTNNQNRQQNGRGRGNFNGNRQGNHNNNNSQNNSNNGNNNSRNFRRGNRGNQSNYRGRGGYRGNYNNYNNYNNNGNNNDRYVRVMAENYPGPSNGRAEQESAQANQPTILRLAQNNRQ